jgi:hypothetical protein
MRRRWFLRALRFVAIAAVFIAVFGAVVMGLWNWLVPSLFGGHRIAYVQALGILLLARILFGRFWGRPGGNWGWRHRITERWAAMTPEEREKFREGMRGRCGFRAPQAEPKAPTT